MVRLPLLVLLFLLCLTAGAAAGVVALWPEYLPVPPGYALTAPERRDPGRHEFRCRGPQALAPVLVEGRLFRGHLQATGPRRPPADLIDEYRRMLERAGWTVLDTHEGLLARREAGGEAWLDVSRELLVVLVEKAPRRHHP